MFGSASSGSRQLIGDNLEDRKLVLDPQKLAVKEDTRRCVQNKRNFEDIAL